MNIHAAVRTFVFVSSAFLIANVCTIGFLYYFFERHSDSPMDIDFLVRSEVVVNAVTIILSWKTILALYNTFKPWEIDDYPGEDDEDDPDDPQQPITPPPGGFLFDPSTNSRSI